MDKAARVQRRYGVTGSGRITIRPARCKTDIFAGGRHASNAGEYLAICREISGACKHAPYVFYIVARDGVISGTSVDSVIKGTAVAARFS